MVFLIISLDLILFERGFKPLPTLDRHDFLRYTFQVNAPDFQELDESIYDLLEHVRRRPAMFIGVPSIFRLDSFLGGYRAGLGRVRFSLRECEDFHRFHDWVARRLGYSESTSGWVNMIRDKSASDEEAFSQFYALLAEFKKDKAPEKPE
jgi:hypothetical protein